MKSKADKRKHLKACSERAPPAPELCQAIPNAAGHRGRSRLFPEAAQRAQRSAGISRPACAVTTARASARGARAEAEGDPRPFARRCSPTPAEGPRPVRPRSQPGAAHSPALPHSPVLLTPWLPLAQRNPPTAQPGVAAASPSDLKMAPLTSRRRRCPPGLAERGARWERCRGDGRARQWRGEPSESAEHTDALRAAAFGQRSAAASS